MPLDARIPVRLTTSDARRIWLRAQRLDQPTTFGTGTTAVSAVVAHLGYVQIDTINVIERSHHHILWTRIPEYRRTDLRHALAIDKSVFEYWTHALSYVPTCDIRFFLPAMQRHSKSWFSTVKLEDVRRVVELIRTGGPLSIRDIDDEVLVEKDHPWASRKPSKRALQLAFYTGILTVSSRRGMVKTYELTDRHFSWDKRPKAASELQVLKYLLDRALRSQGVVSLDSICHLDAGRKAAIRKLIEARVRRKLLLPVAVDGAGKLEHWVQPELLESPAPPGAEMVHLLSPFDPLIIQRKRLQLFFDYGHRFEAYVPKAKRVLGYFALPVLCGDAIVAAIDLKADREKQKLLVQQWTWFGSERSYKSRVEDELHRFGGFQFDRQQ